MEEFEPVRRCRSGGEPLGSLDECRGGEQDKGALVEFSSRRILILSDQFVRLKHRGLSKQRLSFVSDN